MAITYIDTERLKDINLEISNLIKNYYNEINSMFNKFSNVPYLTREWVGQSSEKYFGQVMLEKQDYLEFGRMLEEYNKAILDTAIKADNCISNCKNIESGDRYY